MQWVQNMFHISLVDIMVHRLISEFYIIQSGLRKKKKARSAVLSQPRIRVVTNRLGPNLKTLPNRYVITKLFNMQQTG